MYKTISYVHGTKDAMNEIGDNTSQFLDETMGLNLGCDNDGEVFFTISSVFCSQIFKYLAENTDKKVSVGSIMSFYADIAETDDGEKTGNIVPAAEFGNNDSIGASLYDKAEFAMSDEQKSIAKAANAILKNEYEIKFNSEEKGVKICYAIALTYLNNVLKFLLQHPKEKVHLDSLFTLFVAGTTEEGEVQFGIEFGERAKLGMKNDNATEDEEEDE